MKREHIVGAQLSSASFRLIAEGAMLWLPDMFNARSSGARPNRLWQGHPCPAPLLLHTR